MLEFGRMQSLTLFCGRPRAGHPSAVLVGWLLAVVAAVIYFGKTAPQTPSRFCVKCSLLSCVARCCILQALAFWRSRTRTVWSVLSRSASCRLQENRSSNILLSALSMPCTVSDNILYALTEKYQHTFYRCRGCSLSVTRCSLWAGSLVNATWWP